VNLETGIARPVAAVGDTFVRNNARPEMTQGALRYRMVPGFWSGGWAIGDPNSYRIALYDPAGTLIRVLGRNLPTLHPSKGRVDEEVQRIQHRMEGRGGKLAPADLAQIKKEIGEGTLPQFTTSVALDSDSKGRIWVMGVEGDSAFADLFSSTQFLGRIEIPCRMFNGAWSLSGSWLATACLPDNPGFEGDAVIKVFRVDG
jgi:hypothetical protein